MTTLTTYQFTELIRKTRPHLGVHSGQRGLRGLRLDSDGCHLHAIASDRHTLAVAREPLTEDSDGPVWARTIAADDLDTVTSWVEGCRENARITLTVDDHTLTFAPEPGRSRLPVETSSTDWPDWRALTVTALDAPLEQVTAACWNSKLLARWQAGGYAVTTWQANPTAPLIVIGHNLLGLQMPLLPRAPEDTMDPAAARAQWQTSLDPTAPHDRQVLSGTDASAKLVDDFTVDLLQQILRSTTDVFSAATGDPAALAAYALAGGRSWIAYRFLEALAKAAPDLLHTTITTLAVELDSGEFGELAWHAAEQAGHDPQAWHDAYEKHLAAWAAQNSPA
ncbi:hypothetical protein [Streptomyces luteireticuli]|uniref:hypothetical protein n=1 Tax=Streptomyces luteireticuli TaxID=173858 RepID=UPI0035582A92